MNYFSFFNINIPSYSIMILIGLIIGNVFAFFIIKKRNLILDDFILIETYGLAFGMLGAKLLYLFICRKEIDFTRILDWNYIQPYIKGGFVFYGGFIGGLIGIYLVKIIHKIDVLKYLSELIFCIPLVHGFGRIGCYLSGCCYGIPYNGPFNIEYHNIPYTLCDVNLFPIQLVEAISLFLLAIIFFSIILKYRGSIKLILYYFISYSILRFFIEFYRYDSARGGIWILSTSQWISLIILIISIIILIFNRNLCTKVTNAR